MKYTPSSFCFLNLSHTHTHKNVQFRFSKDFASSRSFRNMFRNVHEIYLSENTNTTEAHDSRDITGGGGNSLVYMQIHEHTSIKKRNWAAKRKSRDLARFENCANHRVPLHRFVWPIYLLLLLPHAGSLLVAKK